MTSATSRRIQMAMAVVLVIVTVRAALIFYGRYKEKNATEERTAAPPLDPDAYVVPRKLYAYDLKSARQLVGQPVWVREGYRSAYFPCEPARSRCDFEHQAGLLGPIQRLEVKDVIRVLSPRAPGEPQIMLIFEQEGPEKDGAKGEQQKTTYGFSVGSMRGEDCRLYIDDMLYLDDPHHLYRHWPAKVWQAVDEHQARKEMNELQVGFALGTGYLHGTGLGSTRVLTYPNGGKPLVVTFEQGRAVDIQPAPPGT